MQIKYYQTAWNDIKNSPGWLGKLCLLALVNFIPIFGQIVTYGYLYGWAREIAWGVHQPMPASIFSNEDGKFWRRGWFLLVIAFVFSLVPEIIMGIGTTMQNAGLYASVYGLQGSSHIVSAGSAASASVGSLLYLVGLVLALLISIFMWVASMRSAIYDRLSAGFQLGKLWKMFRHDTPGIMRIFGMNLLVGFILVVVFTIALTVVVVGIVATGAISAASVSAAGSDTGAFAALASMGGVALFVILVLVYVLTVGSMFVEALVARAVGYWTMQFDVPRWRGQDDPMPFEQEPSAPTYPTL